MVEFSNQTDLNVFEHFYLYGSIVTVKYVIL